MARARATRLADRCDTLWRATAAVPAGAAPPRRRRVARFRKQLRIERDRLDARASADAPPLAPAPGADAPLGALLAELARLAQALAEADPHNPAPRAQWAADGVRISQALEALWQAEARRQDAAGTDAPRHVQARAPDWRPRRPPRPDPRPRARRRVDRPAPEWLRCGVLEAAQRYLAAMPAAGGGASVRLQRARKAWDAKTRKQFLSAARLLDKAFPAPIWTLQQADLQRFAAVLDRLPARSHHKTERHETMTLDEIAREAEAQVAAGALAPEALGLLPPTTNRHFRFLRRLCDWVRRSVPQMAPLYWEDFLYADDRDPRDLRVPFTREQGQALFALPIWTGCQSVHRRLAPGHCIFHDAAYWVPLLLWYTGARREEVCKLLLTDIARDGEIAYLRIDITETGRIKSRQARRLIPLADELIRLGFLDYVAALRARGETLLFPDLLPRTAGRSRGDVYYKRFWRAMARHLPFLAPGMAVHAFRHMVSTELKDAEVYVETRSDLLGHAHASSVARRYAKATRLRTLARIVNQIPVVTGHLDRARCTLTTLYWRPAGASDAPDSRAS